MVALDRHELIDAFRVSDEQGGIHAVEVWAEVSYEDTNDRATRRCGPPSYYLRDGTRLIRNPDATFSNPSTGRLLRYLPTE